MSTHHDAGEDPQTMASDQERHEALDPAVGAGTPESAPLEQPPAERSVQETDGVAPKTQWATGAAVVSAVLSYLLTQELVDWPPAAELAINVVAIGVATFTAAYQAGPGRVVRVFKAD